MAERIHRMLAERNRDPLVIPYLTAGYPDPGETLGLLLALEQGGADAIELGLPFSDPLADGPVIQATSKKALDAGIDHGKILTIAEAFRKRSQVPLVVMGYLNPILAYGAERFFVDAVAAGVDGIIVPDLPPEEASPFHGPAVAAGLSWIFLAAPTSSAERLSRIDALSVDMSYCVAVTGVTGARKELSPDLTEYLERAEKAMEKPFVVGFGISNRAQINRVVPPAVGVVVGSALLRALADEADAPGRRRRAEKFLRGLRSE